MASPIHAVLADPDHREEPDTEICDTDSFVLIRAEETPSVPSGAHRPAGLTRHR